MSFQGSLWTITLTQVCICPEQECVGEIGYNVASVLTLPSRRHCQHTGGGAVAPASDQHAG